MNTSNVRKLFAALCASACALMSSAATTYTWTGAVNNKWSDPGNWKVGTAIATSHPHTNDDVVLYDSTSYASAEIELDIDGTTTVSHIVSSRGHLTITGIPGAVLSLYETVSPGASGIVVGRDSDLTTDRVLTLDVPVVTPTRRFDKWYGGTLEIVSAFTNLFNSASEYGFIWGAGSNLLTQAADVYIPNSRTATGCGNPSGVPSYLVISDAARLRARSLDLETRGSSGPGAYAIQNGANTVVTLGDLWIGYGGLATAENSYYRMEAGTLTAGRMIVGGNGGRTCNGCGRFEQLGGTVTVGTFLWGKVPEYDRYLLSGGTFLVSETQTLPDRIEISGTPAFGATAGKTLTVPQWPAGLEGAFVKKGAGRVSLGADFATARVIDVQEGSLDLTALASATVHPDGCLVKVATGASFTLNTSPFSAKLRIEAEEGAQVTLPNGVTAEGFMKVAGGTTYDVPSGTTQTLPVPMQIVGAGGLVKRGAGTLKVLAGFTSDHPLSVEAGRFTLMAGSRVEPSAEGGTWDVSISASGVLEVASYDAHVNVPLNLEIADGGRIQGGNYGCLVAHSLIYAGTPIAKGYYRSGSAGSTFISANQKVYVLVPYVWTGNGDGKSWSDAANWDSNTVPQDNYDTVVDLSAATQAVELSSDVTVGCAIANPTGGVCTVTGDATLKTYGPTTWGPVLLVGDNRTFEFDVNVQRQSGPFYRAMGGGTLRFKKDVPGYGTETGKNTWTAAWQMLVNVEYAGETTVRTWNSTSGSTLIHEGVESGRQKVTLADGAKVTVSGNFGVNVAGVPFGSFVQENAEVAANAFYLDNLSSDRPTHYLMKDGKLSLTSGNQPGFQMGTRYTSAAYLPGGTFRQEGGRVWTPKFSSACYGQKLELVGGTFEVGAYGLLLDTTQSYSDYEDYKDLCAIRFAGGTLKATAAWMKTEVGIECTAAGGTLDTGANNVTFAAPIRGAGGFTKTGAGTLTLTSADNAFSSLAVSGGVVKFDTAASAPAGLDLNLASRASLDVPAGVTLEAANVTVNGRVCSRGRTLACGAGHVHVNAGPIPSPLIITIQ